MSNARRGNTCSWSNTSPHKSRESEEVPVTQGADAPDIQGDERPSMDSAEFDRVMDAEFAKLTPPPEPRRRSLRARAKTVAARLVMAGGRWWS